ncbi:hypothetical protein NSQ24_01445 [Brevibacillus sp. FSL L8-0520]|uniref:hypothetical protein n=1 Tax=Brevibacillus sp. FSL L8-0520 TaxID=2954689 RepID=UPI0030CEB5EE
MARRTGTDQDSDQQAVKYAKEQIVKVAEQKFGLNRTEAIAAFFNAPDDMTVEEAEQFVKQFKERTVE